MFQYPATHQFSRTYGGVDRDRALHTTSKKNANKENVVGGGLPSKTPSRTVLGKQPVTSMRTGLGVKTVEKNVNVMRQTGETGKGKGKEGHEIEPKRLFGSTTKPQTTLHSDHLDGSSSTTPFPKKTVQKTPAPRQKAFQILRTPAPGSFHPSPSGLPSIQRPSTLAPTPLIGRNAPRRSAGPGIFTPLPSSSVHQAHASPSSPHTANLSVGPSRRVSGGRQPTPQATPLPSATRQRRRSRSVLSTPSQPTPVTARLSNGIGGQNPALLQTPAPTYWEEELSLESITEGLEGVELGALNEVDELGMESDDEVEYMPPPVEPLPWEPSFDVLDLKTIFTKLSTVSPLMSIGKANDLSYPEFEPTEEAEVKVELCSEEMLEDPIFRTAPAVQGIPSAHPGAGKTMPFSSRPAVTAPRLAQASRPLNEKLAGTTSRVPMTKRPIAATATRPLKPALSIISLSAAGSRIPSSKLSARPLISVRTGHQVPLQPKPKTRVEFGTQVTAEESPFVDEMRFETEEWSLD